MEVETSFKHRRQVGRWRTIAIILALLCIGLIVGVIVLAIKLQDKSNADLPICGESTDTDIAHSNDLIDLTEPEMPGPFHDLTKKEIQNVRHFLEEDSEIRAVKAEEGNLNTSMIFMMDLFLPKKLDVLNYLDGKGRQPSRSARVLMFRGDLMPPKVIEYICGPLPTVSKCSPLVSSKRRNPVEYSMRPISLTGFWAVYTDLIPKLQKEIGYIIEESFGATFVNCKPSECLVFNISPVGTNLTGDINRRLLWIWVDYPVEYYNIHPTGMGILLDISGSQPSMFTATKIWYNNQLFESTDDLIRQYNSSANIRVKVSPPKYSRDLHSTLNRRGDPLSEKVQRPPTLVEPDGKRYTLKNRKVEYLGWSFNFRLSSLSGPSLYDIRYKNERIAYELGLSEIGVIYSANNPMQRATDFIDSGALIGVHAKSLVPGADCPESATFINQTFVGQFLSIATEIDIAMCLFENNNGYPLRRHLSYSIGEGAFYGGMLDSVLTLRSALTIANYDYIVDFMFHQNGVVETRVMSTGYIFPSVFSSTEKQYGFRIDDSILGNLHHHMFHFKADLDIGGTSNRYETLNLKPEQVNLRVGTGETYNQMKYERQLKKSEKEALYKFNFDEPKYHVVHNNADKTKFGEIKSYRIGLHGMSKQMIPEDAGNERTFSWARHQLVVTKHNDEEVLSSSPYAMYDSYNPVTDFTTFYEDDENIVDEDLVFWIAQGLHHIPHTEDLPVTPTVGNHLTFFLFPYNYFDECPSMASRDQIRIEPEDRSDPKKGLRIDRNGNTDKQCIIPQKASAYNQLVKDDPDVVIESRRDRGIF